MKILQAILGRSRAAHDLTFAAAAENYVDLLLITELNKTIDRKSVGMVDSREDAGAVSRNKNLGIVEFPKLDEAVTLKISTYIAATFRQILLSIVLRETLTK